jgi:NADH:ubiquinone oxidoreductase subunit 6 (subunit J)
VKTRDKRFFNLIKRLRPVHKAAGLMLAVIALVHGYMALNGRIALHTGLLVYVGFFVTVLLGIWHHFAKNRKVFKAHKAMVLISFLLMLLHLIKPWAMGQWFNIW